MKEEKLLDAIGGIDDDLIASAMETNVKKHPSWVRWAAVAACVCLLLTATVGAAKWGVEWKQGQGMGYMIPHDTESDWNPEKQESYTVEWKYPFEPVTIRQEAYDEMSAELNRWWAYWYERDGGYDPEMADYLFTTGFGYDLETRFVTIGELEEYLGIDFALSPEIEAAARNCMLTNDIHIWLEGGIYGDLYRDAETEYLETGKITLHGIALTVRMGFSKTNCKSWVDIYIPLTQKFADSYPAESIFNYDENKPFKVEELQFSGRDVLVIQDSADSVEVYDTHKAYGIYSADGIGYCVHCLVEDWDDPKNHLPLYDTGKERLVELLENLE